jgi:hypothetical protein
MAAATHVDLALRIVHEAGRVRGSVSLGGRKVEDFDGWLELSAAIARTIDAAASEQDGRQKCAEQD